MTISYTDGRKDVEVESEEEARRIIDEEYPEAEYSEWQQSAYTAERMLVWSDLAAANNDDGQNAVAEIIA